MSDIDDLGVICANPECRVAETGRCIEGIATDACPHYGRTLLEALSEEGGDELIEPPHGVQLPSADTLTSAAVTKILCALDSRVVAIVGPSDAGKTSLIAAFYDLFQMGDVSGAKFARSYTFHAFEHTCHDARMASRRTAPHVNRTPYGEVGFYHIELKGGPAGDGLALLLGDRAGEEYKNAGDDISLPITFPEIPRADSLTLLVDGEKMLDVSARHNLRSQIHMILQSFVESGAVKEGHRLALVLTKIDKIRASAVRARTEDDFNSLSTSVRKIFGSTFSVIEQFQIAASPKTEAMVRGTGIAELLKFWAEPNRHRSKPIITNPTPQRAFSRLEP